MNDFKLPMIKEDDKSPKRVLSMDEYVEFVMFNLKYTVDKKVSDDQKKKIAVNVPFSFK